MEICVVLVTFNRLNCLKKALDEFEKQTYLPKRLIVVNNSSTDGTAEYLSEWKKTESNFEKIVITTERNLGGAGGFALGLKEASKYSDTDWIWLSDDDAFVKPNTLATINNVYQDDLKSENIAALFTSVINNGEYDLSHRRIVKKDVLGIKMLPVAKERYKNKYFELAQGSYVGMLIKNDLVKKFGVTKEEYFIYYDDTEHCERLRRHGKLICVPSAEIVHDIEVNTQYSWKSYYGARNSTILIKEYYGVYPALLNVLKRYIKEVSFLSKNNSKSVKKMIKTGLKDGLLGKTGLHNLYKPGWKIEN